jgi:sigma-B regulation protein RsbU (phosphoserine phosphatase)
MSTHSPASSANRWPYLWLAILFAVVMAGEVTFTLDVLRSLRLEYPYPPIWVGSPWPTIVEVNPIAAKSGLRVGDRVTSIDGRVPRGTQDLRRALHARKPGETLSVMVEREGQPLEGRIRLWISLPRAGLPAIVTFLFMPWCSIALAFWVAAVRPRDPRVWMMVAILVGISQIESPAVLSPFGWPLPIAVPAALLRQLAAPAWGIGMMLFGLFFPQRGRIDAGAPWLKWVLIAPLAFIGVWDAVREVGLAVSYASALRPNPLPEWFQTAALVASVSIFFMGVGEQFGNPQLAPDSRRRLKLLYWGCTLALTPQFIRMLYSWIFLHQNPHDDVWVIPGGMAEALFPLTMAYVVVVQRALDVRMVVRQGVQYALAQRGVVVIQLVVMAVISGVALNYAESHRLNYFEQSLLVAVGVGTIVQVRAQADRVRRWVDRRFFREAYNAERILGELGEQVRSILDRDALLETVTRKISESLHVERIAVMLQDGGFFRPALATGYPTSPDVAISCQGPTASQLFRSREPLPVGQALPPDSSDLDHKALQQLDAQLLLPLASRKELLGFISMGPKRSEEPYSPSDANLLSTVAAQTGLALENTRLSEAIATEVAQREMLNREIEIAREVQQRLFPQTLPEVVALEYAGYCRPARGVGGDYYDFLALSSGRLGLAIADISGKGIPAALLMASLQASVRGQSQSEDPNGRPDVCGLMANVNVLLCDASQANRYATFFYGLFNPATRKLVYTNGGHNPPMVLRGSEVLLLENGGPPVGLFKMSRYVQDEIVLQTGDLLILYTDGMSEAENPAEEEWGEAALIATVRACSGLPPSEMITRVMQAADSFAAGAPQHDDMTLVIARVVN